MTPIVFLDTETTGVHPDRKVWEVAMIRRDGSEQNELTFMVGVEDLSAADPFGLNVGRFYERHPRGRLLSGPGLSSDDGDRGLMSRARAAEYVAQWTHGAHIVGAVPNFDTEVLGALLREHRLLPMWHYHLIDVENLAVGWLWRKVAENVAAGYLGSILPTLPWDSEEISRACGVEPAPPEERHTALGDARWAMRLYDAITGGPA